LPIKKFDPNEIKWSWKGVIYGEPASKENSRRLVTNPKTGKIIPIKSKKAAGYVRDFQLQCPLLTPLLEGDLLIAMEIFYASYRPDLDDSLILDCMQNRIYLNDRQVKERHLYHSIDKRDPRVEICVGLLSDRLPWE